MRTSARQRCGLLLGLMLLPLLAGPARAEVTAAQVEAAAKALFPGAERVEPFSGEPPAGAVYAGSHLLGYVTLSNQVLRIPAYSGKPINTLVAVGADGRLAGARIMEHQEPILAAGISEQQLAAFVEQYAGKPAGRPIRIGAARGPNDVVVDGISGATITVMVLNETITSVARKLAQTRGPGIDPAAAAGSSVAEPFWRQTWRERRLEVVLLALGLAALLGIMTFQDSLARHPRQLRWVRNGFLAFTLVFIGWYALAQLSVVNVLTFVNALRHDFRWDTFLVDPLLFILWGFVAVTLLLWGRGVYCGWLCPFGALQELLYQLGRRLGLRWDWEFPQVVHERLEAMKYLVFLGLFGLSLQSIGQAARYLEVEPFKTAITLRFQREGGYLLYVGLLLALALVNRKFYCKYLCPLGAALAIPARLRLFDWLRRRKECGRPCQICAHDCEVRAIRATGEINANECHYCLDCQVSYWSDQICPPLVERRRRREAREQAQQHAQHD